MKLQLINGQFSPQAGLDLLTRLTQVKLSHHERQIATAATEEDVKFREQRIKALQRNLEAAQRYIAEHGQEGVSLQAEITLIVP